MDTKEYIQKLRRTWMKALYPGAEILIKWRNGKIRRKVILVDQRNYMILVDMGEGQNTWVVLESCSPVPEYMNLEIYKALNGE